MDDGIGEGLTRGDHGGVSDQLYAAYAEGVDLRDLENIVGREALDERQNKLLDFADRFEAEFVQQGYDTNRDIEDTLETGWDLLGMLPRDELNRVDEAYIDEYHDPDDRSEDAEEVTAD